jgi:hypothetical protein
MGSSPGGGALPPGDALASQAWLELLLSAAGIEKEVNIINRDDVQRLHRKEPGCVKWLHMETMLGEPTQCTQ